MTFVAWNERDEVGKSVLSGSKIVRWTKFEDCSVQHTPYICLRKHECPRSRRANTQIDRFVLFHSFGKNVERSHTGW